MKNSFTTAWWRLPLLAMAVLFGTAQSAEPQAPMADPTRAPFMAAASSGGGVAQPMQMQMQMPGTPGFVPGGARVNAPSNGAPEASASDAAMFAKSMQLSSVMLSGDPSRSIAIVDGLVYRQGDKIKGLTLVSLDARGVTLRAGKGSPVRLSIYNRPPDLPATAAKSASQPSSPSVGASAPDKESP